MDFTSLALPLLLLLFVLGLFLIIKGGDAFVDAASWIALRSGIPTFIIGATIVSLATTLPEVLVSIFATLRGSADMAVGNAIGSVTANTGLILAVSLLAMPSAAPRKIFLRKGILLLGTITTLFIFTRSGTLLPLGQLLLFLLLVLFLAENLYAAKAARCEDTMSGAKNYAGICSAENNVPPQVVSTEKSAVSAQIGLFILGAAGIAAGSQLLVESATELAVRLSVPEVVIAVTIVSVGTALPELVTAITAITKKEMGLSAGNILGANIIDTALILPLCSQLNGGEIFINAQSMRYDIPICLLCIAICTLPTLFTQKFQRWQGAIALLVYLIYLIVITIA